MRAHITILFCIFMVRSSAQQTPYPYPTTSTLNYVQTFDVKYPTTNNANVASNTDPSQVLQSFEYIDGRGRTVQRLTKQGSPAKKDQVAALIYDNMGRQTYQYMPFVSSQVISQDVIDDGKFKVNAFRQQNTFCASQYATQAESNFYTYNKYELSPLNRVQESYAPGKNWSGTASQPAEVDRHGVDFRYSFNVANDEVLLWTVTESTTGGYASYAPTYYATGQLQKKVDEDEHGGEVLTFTDQDGHIVLKKVLFQAARDMGTGSGGHTGWLCTYYIYDAVGNLRCVIQPEGVKQMIASGSPLTLSANILSEFCFRYEYDNLNRMTMKQIPGAGTTELVYDGRDRLVMSRDAHLTTIGYWNVYKYDDLNRLTQIGLVANATSRTTHQTSSTSDITYPILATADLMQENYYDNYSWTPTGIPNAFVSGDYWSAFFNMAPNTAPEYAQAITPDYSNIKGLQTGTKVRVLGSTTYLIAVIFYDDKGRVIQTREQNISGGVDYVTTQYDFSGRPIRVLHRQDKQVAPTKIIKELTKYTYDHAGRVKTIVKKIGQSGTEKTIVQNAYDELGELKTKTLGNNLETQNFEYNVRGWSLGYNRDYVKGTTNNNYFGFELGYDNKQTIIGTGANYLQPSFRGEIGGTLWKSAGDQQIRQYNYYYDALSRMTAAYFYQYAGGVFTNPGGLDFRVDHIGYDYNGNFQTMNQTGWLGTTSGLMDQMSYSYKNTGISNKLGKVTDATAALPASLGDFHDGTNSDDDYDYDASGNLTIDKNKGITAILYTHQNRPYEVDFGTKGKISYLYDNAGNKLKKTIVDNTSGSPVTTTWMYMKNYVYKNDTLQFFTFEEGRARFDVSQIAITEATSFNWDYFLKDHLGNVRMVLTEEVAAPNYYPAATLEGTYTAGGTPANSMVNTERNYYKIDPSKIVSETSIPSWGTETTGNTKLYYNNNGNPPTNLSYPSGCAPVQTDGSTKLYKLNATSNKTGLEFMIKVMAGDKIDIFGKSYYLNTTNVTNTNSTALDLLSIMTNLIATPASAAASHGLTAANLNSLNTGLVPSGFFRGSNSEPTTTVPKAYINYIFLDEQFRYAGGSYSRVGVSATVKDHYADPQLQNISVPKNGYVFVYVSNESNFDVYFDNLQVIHKPGPIMEETHYYPYGLTMAGISSKASGRMENRFKFNGGTEFGSKELADGSGLELYETPYRQYDPQIGRFHQSDPMASISHEISPYAFANDDPIYLNDPLGLLSDSSHPDLLAQVVVTPTSYLDIANGQIEEPRSWIWDVISGPRVFDSHRKVGGSSMVLHYIIDENGYLTNRTAPTSLVWSASVDKNPVVSIKSVIKLKNFVKSEYVVYRATKNGLPYFGKALRSLMARYGSAAKIEEINARVIQGLGEIPSNAVALGIEQLCIDLNGGVGTGVLANINNATTKELFINEARYWLDSTIPNWEQELKIQ